MKLSKPAPAFWIQQVRDAAEYLVANLAYVGAKPSLMKKGPPRLQVDVSHHVPLDGTTIRRMADLHLYLVEDLPVSGSVRRLAFQVGGDPPVVKATPPCPETGPLCEVCTRRFRSILAMYGLTGRKAGDTGVDIQECLRGLCRLQGGPWSVEERRGS